MDAMVTSINDEAGAWGPPMGPVVAGLSWLGPAVGFGFGFGFAVVVGLDAGLLESVGGAISLVWARVIG